MKYLSLSKTRKKKKEKPHKVKLKLSKWELLSKGESELESRSKSALILCWVHVCVEFMWQDFGAGSCRDGSWQKILGAAPTLDGDNFRQLQGWHCIAQAESVLHTGGTSECAWKRVWGTGGRNNCRNWGQREESKEELQELEQSLQPGEETLVKQILPLEAHEGPWWSRYPPCSPGSIPQQSRHRCSEGSWSL